MEAFRKGTMSYIEESLNAIKWFILHPPYMYLTKHGKSLLGLIKKFDMYKSVPFKRLSILIQNYEIEFVWRLGGSASAHFINQF